MFEKYRQRKAKERAIQEKIKNDNYLSKLQNSIIHFCGTRYSTSDRNTLSIYEIQDLMVAELERLTPK